jgi:hypothetical protein
LISQQSYRGAPTSGAHRPGHARRRWARNICGRDMLTQAAFIAELFQAAA